jgi:hypothetical protein
MLRKVEEHNSDLIKIKNLLFILNIFLVVFDFVWVLTMGVIWKKKPTHDASVWESFSGLHTFIITFSIFNIIL